MHQVVLTVDQCLRIPPLASATVVGGRAGLGVRRVRWFAVIEWPVENFVAPGELVLTTGIGCDGAMFEQLAREVADSDAAGLCVCVGPSAPMKAVPDAVRELGDNRRLPVLELPWEVRFAEVLRALTDRLLSARYAAALDARDQLPAGFTDALLHRDGLSAIAQALEGMVARPVVVLDSGLAPSAYGPLARERGVGEPAAGGGDAHPDLPAAATALRQRLHSGGVHPIGPIEALGLPSSLGAAAVAQGSTLGYVLALDDGRPTAEPLQVERHALQHAAVAVAIETLRRRAAAEASAQASGDFVWELASGMALSRQEVVAKAALLDYDVERRYRLALAVAETADGEALDDLARRIRRRGGGEALHASRRANRVLVVVPEDGSHGLQPAALAAAVTNPEQAGEVTWGIADGVYGLLELADGLRRAERAVEVGRALRGPGVIADAAELGPFFMLGALARDEQARATAAELLTPLERYDSETSRDLVRTLEIVLEEQGNISSAARRLYLNRHSLMYRLRKIEALTGRDLARHEDRFLFELSLRLRRLASS